MSTQETQETLAAAAVVACAPVKAETTYKWTLELYGSPDHRAMIKWSTDAPFRAQQGKVCLYDGKFPANPEDNVVAWAWDDKDKNPFNTGQRWGAGWCAAYIAQAGPNGPYVYFLKTPVVE
jgi:LmbE family N-acetylglucosaminyl deacetylase